MAGGHRDATQVDAALFELFLEDARANVEILKDGLPRLMQPGENPKALARELARAAHSVRGAARIVQLEATGHIAEALENRLSRVEQGELELTSDIGPRLLAATEALDRIARQPASELANWERTHDAYVESVMQQFSDPAFRSAPPRSAAPLPSLRTPLRRSLLPVDPSIFALFRGEAETCLATLSRGLVEIESGGGGAFEELMRAAHSFKGALRVIDVPAAIRVAHAIEECFVAAQQGRLRLLREHVDLLLSAVDLLGEIGTAPATSLPEWQTRRGEPAEQLARQLEAVAAGTTQPPSALTTLTVREAGKTAEALVSRPPSAELRAVPPEPLASLPERRSAPPASVPPKQERVVRVAAASINRLMGLAGESLVESRRVQSLTRESERLKRRHAELEAALERLGRESRGELSPRAEALLSEAKERAVECRSLLAAQVAELDGYARRVDDLSDRLYREALKSRMRPFRDGAHGLPRMVRDIARQLDKQVRLVIVGEGTDVDRDVLESLESPLHHLLRNAVDHGIESPRERLDIGKPAQGTLRVEARHHAGMLAISVSDDGRGIDTEMLRRKIVDRKLLGADMAKNLSAGELTEFVFLPGFSTASSVTEISGRGVGLDAVRSAVEAASGTVRVTSEAGRGTTFHLQLPITRSVMRAVVADVAGEPYAFPLLRIERILRVALSEVRIVGGSQFILIDDQNVALVSARQLLGGKAETTAPDELLLVVIGDRLHRYAIVVDRFLGEHDLVVRPLDARLGKVQDIAAAAILMDGTPSLILDVDDIVRSIEKLAQIGRIDRLASVGEVTQSSVRRRILVVDDSITVREAERQLLLNRGYDVDVAVDGIDGWNSVRSAQYDLVISDIDMPRMNGIELVRSIKQDARLCSLPVVIVSYKDRTEDRMRGLDAGANYYLTKSSFHDETLLEAVEDLIGSSAA